MKMFLPLITAVLLLLPISAAVAEPQESIVQTGDIDRFWQAYDAVRAAGDTPARLELLRRLYLDPATPGLRALMAARHYTLPEYVEAIEQYMVLIGAEIALSDETVDVSELREPLRTRLGAYVKTRPFANNSQNNVHELAYGDAKAVQAFITWSGYLVD